MAVSGKVALVTGSGRGIGREIALAFARNGADIVTNAVHPANAEKVAQEIRALGKRAFAAPGDVSKRSDVEAVAGKAREVFGRVDILVNNAGINIVNPVEEMSEEEWRSVMDVNLNAVFLCSKIIGGQMVRRGWGRIINIASVAGINAFPGRGPYSTSKAGVIMFTRVLAIEWAKHGVTVNAIAPGFFKTDMVLERFRRGELREEAILKRVPMKRLGNLEDIGRLATFLASEDAAYITGQVIAIDGGYTAYGFVE